MKFGKKTIIRNILKKIGVFSLILLLSFFVVFSCFNRASEVKANPIVIGGAIIAGLGAFMASAGITITNNGIQDGSGLQTAWENILHDFSYDNKALQDWYQGGNEIVNFIIGKENNAKIAVIGKEFTNWLNEAKKWIVQQFSLNSNSDTSIITPATTANGVPLYSGNTFDYGTRPSIFPFSLGIGTHYVQLSDNVFIKCVYSRGSNSSLLNARITVSFNGGNSYADPFGASYALTDAGLINVLYSAGQFAIAIYQSNSVPSNIYNKTYTRVSDYWDISGVSQSDISVSGKLTDGYSDFEQALEDANTQAGTGEGAVIGVNVGGVEADQPYTQERLIDGVIDSMMDNTLTGELVGGYEDEKEAENETDSSAVPTESDIAGNIVVVDGLEDFFPFCIPWDLYNLVAEFNVAPQAPDFTWRMDFAGRFDSYDVHIDLSPYENVARVFRIMVVIAFVIFLIFKTRDLIRG